MTTLGRKILKASSSLEAIADYPALLDLSVLIYKM